LLFLSLSLSLGVLFLLQNSGFLFASSLAWILASNKSTNLSLYLSLSHAGDLTFFAESIQMGELERERERKKR
jgi:hypothetical protein